MDKTLKIALILTAVDKMTSVISGATNASVRKLQEMQAKSGKLLTQGLAFTGAGSMGFAVLGKYRDAYGELQEASNKLKVSMLQDGGILDQKTFDKLDQFTNNLSTKYIGSAADYKDMVTVMQQNGLVATDILNGTGEAVAKLAKLFQMAPASIGQFAARMKQDMGIANTEMTQMTDLIARLHNAGVGKTGEEAVSEMNEAFSKAGIGAANLNVKGIEASKSLSALMGIFIRRGISGATVGTNFRRIFDGLRDGEKLKKANDVARQYGVTLDMFDKKGQFRGIDNFVGQIGKLQGLNTASVAAILKPFGGRQGLSTDFMEFLAKDGTRGFNEMQEKLQKQATLDQKVHVILTGMNMQAAIAKSSWTNAKAAIGASFAPELTKVYTLMNKVANWVMNFAKVHPTLMKFITISVAVVSAILTIVGAIKLVQFAMMAMRITMLGNPITLAIMAIAIAAVWIYTHWAGIKKFFSSLMQHVKNILRNALNWIIDVFLNYTPLGLIISRWGGIVAYFQRLWDKVQKVFWKVFDWIVQFGFKFYDAGANIIDNIVNGIKSKVHKVVDVIKNLSQKIRNFFPFSPAKEGPLKDIHKVRLVETIAESIKVAPAVAAMRKVGFAIATTGGQRQLQPIGANSGGGGITINYSPEIKGFGTGLIDELRKHDRELLKMFDEALRKRDRTKFA